MDQTLSTEHGELSGYRQSAFNVICSMDTDSAGTPAGSGISNPEETIVFNTLTGALAVLDAEGRKALERCDDAAVPPLVQDGFLIPSDQDDREVLAKGFIEDAAETGFLSLNIAPTFNCNLRCKYCYEEHLDESMDESTREAIFDFVQRRYERFPFNDLEVIWYGGEPTLEIETIEKLSAQLMKWCREKGIEYLSSMITNASLITPTMAQKLANAGISAVMPTLDGLRETHDNRRIKADGTGSFDDTVAGIRALRDVGILVGVSMNMDLGNQGDYDKLCALFEDDPGVMIYANRLRNFYGWHDSCPDKGDFPLMTRKDFATDSFENFRNLNPDPVSIHESLRARRAYCRNNSSSYFSVDPHGNVCGCDGQMGKASHVLFNVNDEDYEPMRPTIGSFYEKRPQCADCSCAPYCFAGCDWEWSMSEWPLMKDNCTVLKPVLKDYIRLMRSGLGAIDHGPNGSIEGHYHSFFPPQDIQELRSEPFRPWLHTIFSS